MKHHSGKLLPMFKAHLISDPRYYELIKKTVILKILFYSSFFILGLFIIRFVPRPSILREILIPFTLASALIIPDWIYKKKIQFLSKKYWFEIDQNYIRTIDINGNTTEVVEIYPGDHIIARKKYVVEDSHWKFLTGDFRPNKLIVNRRDGTRHFYFRPESNYSIRQLDNILSLWQEKGCKVERI